MTVREIRLYPDPVLQVNAERVVDFDSEAARDMLRGLAQDLVETMHDAPGVGLAAPQIGVPLRVVALARNRRGTPRVLVNPEIVSRAGEALATEGCLSIPDFTAKVHRAREVTVVAQLTDGSTHRFVVDDLEARMVQHEIDHLDGVLFVDRIGGSPRVQASRHLKRMRRRNGTAHKRSSWR